MDAKVSVYVLVQARLGSTRLPRKVLMDIAGKSMLERCMERAAQIGPPVVLVIPKDDAELAAYALEREWTYCLGPEEDVLERFRLAAVALKAEHIVRVTADCPFLDVEWARHTLATHLEGGYDLTWDEAEGRGVQVFSVAALVKASNRSFRTERHSPDVAILRMRGLFKVHRVRASVDTTDDLETARRRAQEGA